MPNVAVAPDEHQRAVARFICGADSYETFVDNLLDLGFRGLDIITEIECAVVEKAEQAAYEAGAAYYGKQLNGSEQ
jgi:hypothetical protein